MAKFEQALERTLRWEGGYSNNPNDAGLETYCGISRKWWPDWEGWAFVDVLKSDGGTMDLAKLPLLSAIVAEFYRVNFWTPLHGDEIESQEIANYLFDFAVNSGIGDAVKALQWAINIAYSNKDDPALSVDGIIGNKTLSIVNDAMEYDLEDIISAHMHTYRLYHILKNIGNGKIHHSFAKGLAERAMQ